MRFPISLPAAGSRPFDAVGVGLNTTDLLAVVPRHPVAGSKTPLEDLAILPGGQAATAMTTVSRLGWSARYVGTFGDDANGRAGREALEAAGVEIGATRIATDTPNMLSVILVDGSTGQRTVLWSRHPNLRATPADVPMSVAQSGRLLLVDCHETAVATAAARAARAAGIPTLVDVEKVRPGIEDLLREIDVIITAREFPTQLTGLSDLDAALQALRERFGAAIVCTTMGEEGSLAFVGGVRLRTPAFSIAVVDTTGAGDVFRGGFIAGWLTGGDGADVREVLRYANATAALKCRALGARSGIPSRQEVEALLDAGD